MIRWRRLPGWGWLPLLLLAPAAAGAQPFHVAPVYAAPTPVAASLTTADLNGDGWPDLVGTNGDTHLTIFLNDGTGKLAPPSVITAGESLSWVDIADFDSDSKPDLIVADSGDGYIGPGNLWLFPGDGNGGFGPGVSLDTSQYHWVGALDLNGDGHADLLTVTNSAFGSVTAKTWLGDGSGHFAPPNVVISSTAPFVLKAADFNGDGKPDLAMAAYEGVWIRLGDGAGGFGAPELHQVGGLKATDVVLADFNADGKVDVVASTVGFDGSLGPTYFLAGDGAGGFGIAAPSPGAASSPGLLVGDYNEDGKLDLGARTLLGFTAILGDGAGHFAAGSTYVPGTGNLAVAVSVDLDRDSHFDLVVSGFGVAVMRGDGAGHFDALEALPLPVSFYPQLTVGDFNEDGKLDLGVAWDGITEGESVAWVQLGDGQGGFSAAGTMSGCPFITTAGVGDFNGDSHLDLVARSNQQICVFLGDGMGSLAAPVLTPLSSDAWFAVADFDEDGRSDLVVSQGQNDVVSILLSNGLGGFAPPVDYLMNAAPGPVVAGDWNGDGHADVASWGGVSHDLSVRLGDGLGGLGPRTVMLPGTVGGSTIVGDWNGDGAVDLAVANGFVVLGDGAGAFSAGGVFPAGTAVTAADFDQDGHEDVASATGSSADPIPNALLVSPGDGTGSFGPPWIFRGVPDYSTVAAGDFNGDGRPDIILAYQGALWPFLSMAADLAVAIDDGQVNTVPGAPFSYLATVTNLGPRDAPGARLTIILPSGLLNPVYSPSAGVYDPATGLWTGLNLTVGASAVLTVTGTVDPGATGTLSVAASVAPPAGYGDPNAANNSAADVDVLTPQADLSVQLSDAADPVPLGSVAAWSATVANAGPSNGTGGTLAITLPAGVVFVSSTPGSPQCNESGGIVTCSLPALSPGAGTSVGVTATAGNAGVMTTQASVAGSVPDPQGANDVASEATSVLAGPMRELVPGTTLETAIVSPPGESAPPDIYRVRQSPLSSWEVLVDGVTGDLGAGDGPDVELVDDEAVAHPSVAAGAGGSRSLRFENGSASLSADGYVRVASAGCSLDCDAADRYRIGARETTLFGARFNNTASQLTLVVLRNESPASVSGHIGFWSGSGSLLHSEPFTLPARAALVVNPLNPGIPAILGQSGSLRVSYDGADGALTGKAVAVEPATGFTFDTALQPRPR